MNKHPVTRVSTNDNSDMDEITNKNGITNARTHRF